MKDIFENLDNYYAHTIRDANKNTKFSSYKFRPASKFSIFGGWLARALVTAGRLPNRKRLCIAQNVSVTKLVSWSNNCSSVGLIAGA